MQSRVVVQQLAAAVDEQESPRAVHSFLERKRNELKHKGMEYHQFYG